MILTRSKISLATQALLILVLLGTAFLVQATTFYMWGRVYSARPLFEGEAMPDNPLQGISADQIIGGSDLVATGERNLVKVTIVRSSNNSTLASTITQTNGAYFLYFSATDINPVPVRCLVHETVTEKLLLESNVFNLLPYPPDYNIRYIALQENSTEINGTRDFPDYALPANTYTGIFTRVGKIELANDGTRLINTTTGLATVTPAAVAALQIPQYTNAPFGGNLYLFGAFSRDLYDLPVYYRIRIDNLETSTTSYLSAPLRKTKYTINMTTMTVDSVSVLLGPQTVGTNANCYQLTPLASGNSEFYSFPDLLALWPTAGLNGRHRLTIELLGLPAGKTFLTFADYSTLLLNLDNTSPIARINPIALDPVATPRVYTPGTVPASLDLMNNYLGTYPDNYGGSGNQICNIFDMTGSPGAQYVAFNLTAYHYNGFAGYINSWYFLYHRNDGVSEILLGKQYKADPTPAMADYSSVYYPAGPCITSAYVTEYGFTNKYLYLPKSYLVPAAPGSLCSCAYHFDLVVTTRTTDGYQYLRWVHDYDDHYIRLCM